MTRRRWRITLLAALATLAAVYPITSLFADSSWLPQAVVVIALSAGVGQPDPRGEDDDDDGLGEPRRVGEEARDRVDGRQRGEGGEDRDPPAAARHRLPPTVAAVSTAQEWATSSSRCTATARQPASRSASTCGSTASATVSPKLRASTTKAMPVVPGWRRLARRRVTSWSVRTDERHDETTGRRERLGGTQDLVLPALVGRGRHGEHVEDLVDRHGVGGAGAVDGLGTDDVHGIPRVDEVDRHRRGRRHGPLEGATRLRCRRGRQDAGRAGRARAAGRAGPPDAP